ncbi:alpha/beta fold hydrolase [Chitinophaga sp. GCM10012297]|uniref:Alpha/beta hydrolase n=1 Tax=Chitinophaga chungangae TaxID=2821488 RepID=A0ABS3YKN6_9BACT|nr:alpha/beta hydrolase [Chitinophaga chungangae]MBO9155248.1 alpha/beta hydrolase [Chitinophaga chungangae]
MSKKHIYLISGLGADERVFSRLSFPEDCDVHYLPWINPLGPDEPIQEYASRLSRRILHPNPVLLGLSFGGMMSIEIAKQQPVEKVIIVSSVKHKEELPPYYSGMARLLLRNLPDRLLFGNRHYIVKLFMQSRSEEEKMLLKDYLRKRDFRYMRWALAAVLNWQNEWVPPSTVHIHGSADRPFPRRYVNPTHTIVKGGHFMVMNRAQEISRIIEKELA